MALNVEQIENRLAMMQDAELQKYAAMNKNDPYIMALAVSESNRRKKVRQAQQGMQGQMPQPKVVDRAVQGMAAPMPEDVGIARLSAGDMNFADGGIVAFADGGDVERYQIGGSLTGNTYADTMGFGVLPEQLAMDEYRRSELLRRRKAAEDAERLRFLETAAPETAARLKTEQQLKLTGPIAPTAQELAQFDAASNLYMAERAGRQAATTPRTTQRATAAPAAPAASALDVAAMTRKALETSGKEPNPFASDIEAMGKEKVAAAEAQAKGLEAIQKQFADIYKGREERLTKRESELEGRKDQNLGLALLQAGAAMMSTPGSLGAAIGRGIDTGSKQYVAGLDKLNAAKEKLADARDRLDELNAQRGELSAREKLKAESDIRNAGLSAREDLIKSNQQMYSVNRETALKMVDNQIKVGIAQMQEQGLERRAAAAASRNPTLELLQAVQRDPSLATAYQALHGTKNDLMSQYTDYLGKNPTGTIEDFLKTKAVFSTLSGLSARPVSNLPPGASVAPR